TCTATAALVVDEPTAVTVDNGDDPGRVGWNEVVVTGRGVDLVAEAPTASPSGLLTLFPDGASSDVRRVTFTVGPGAGGAVAGVLPETVAAPPVVGALGDLVAGGGSPGAIAVAIGAAFALGLGHALAPGHGKTLMAAFLVGRSGTIRNAVGLGVSVAVSHTLGVAVLGVLTLAASSAFEPAVIYPYLSMVAAVIVLGLGASLLVRAVARLANRGRHEHVGHDLVEARSHVHAGHPGHGGGSDHDHPQGHGQAHGPEHDHAHGQSQDHGHSHDHAHGSSGRWWRHRHIAIDPAGGWKAFAALGLSGGLVPSASAVVLLLGAVHLGRVELGVVLVAAFGLGMAAALTGVGVLVVLLGGRGVELLSRRAAPGLVAAVPVLAGLLVLGVGAIMTWSALAGFG
nr:high frequency lysogenization protein HflD [Acidimicrobiia bacterium]